MRSCKLICPWAWVASHNSIYNGLCFIFRQCRAMRSEGFWSMRRCRATQKLSVPFLRSVRSMRRCRAMQKPSVPFLWSVMRELISANSYHFNACRKQDVNLLILKRLCRQDLVASNSNADSQTITPLHQAIPVRPPSRRQRCNKPPPSTYCTCRWVPGIHVGRLGSAV